MSSSIYALTGSLSQWSDFIGSRLLPHKSPQIAVKWVIRLREGAVPGSHIYGNVVVVHAFVLRVINGQIDVGLLLIFIQLLIGIVVAFGAGVRVETGVVVEHQALIFGAHGRPVGCWVDARVDSLRISLQVISDEAVFLESP